jgi:hypothetical protein
MPPPAGSIAVVPAESSMLWRWQGSKDSLHIYVEPSLVARVAAESFEFDPARVVVPPLDGLNVPELRSAMFAVDASSSYLQPKNGVSLRARRPLLVKSAGDSGIFEQLD